MGRPWYNTFLMCLQHYISLSATAGAAVLVLLALDADRNASLLPSNSLLIIKNSVRLFLLRDSGRIGVSTPFGAPQSKPAFRSRSNLDAASRFSASSHLHQHQKQCLSPSSHRIVSCTEYLTLLLSQYLLAPERIHPMLPTMLSM